MSALYLITLRGEYIKLQDHRISSPQPYQVLYLQLLPLDLSLIGGPYARISDAQPFTKYQSFYSAE